MGLIRQGFALLHHSGQLMITNDGPLGNQPDALLVDFPETQPQSLFNL